ncbi:MAG TPA: hypothetical protein VNI57_11360 [Candidatus Saccharimonadales bacterium]|nr:hypothetical protein [Candidatus Saccharimonadales bacterium]
MRTPGRVAPVLILAAAALAAVAPLASPVMAQESFVKLEYRLRPETVYDQKFTMNMTIKMEMAGLPQKQAAMAGALMQGMTQELQMALSMDLGALDGQGAMPVTMRVDDVQSAMTVAGQKMPGPPTVSPGTLLMSGRITPEGKMLETHLEKLQGVSPDVVDRLMEVMPKIPDKDLHIGDSFEVPISMTMPIAGSDMEMKGQSVFTLQKISGGQAAFDVQQDFSMAAGAAGATGGETSGMDLQVKGGGHGSAVFDIEEGIFSRMSIDMKLEASVATAAPSAAAAGDAGQPGGDAQPGKFTINIDASGPMEMTFARRAASK